MATFDLDDDLERYISLFMGYLNSLGINPLAENDGPPTSRDRKIKKFYMNAKKIALEIKAHPSKLSTRNPCKKGA
ncbi:hypothetical protein RhiirA4_454065 [Rhizophagus irregularis]|uniref:Uncharacterized protein n=1 Tax=Rhizophagus irregularis TaxID=588596 RepID=A0A2I1G1Z1_9GLOM|nr:hypothetical protein RhiirA4_454065 [Rhizophagus irregularis]